MLPGLRGSVEADVQRRAADWAQPFPEWGLAGNAALIIGPRATTRGIDLGRRTFMHSYVADADPEGAALEAILTAPLVVAHGLSAQYYASTVDPQRRGSGTKAIHNVVGGVGVLAGAGGDLLTGLPWQCVADGEQLVHEPMRLLVLVEAPVERVHTILGAHANVKQLIDGEWVRLLVREPGTADWVRVLNGTTVPVPEASAAELPLVHPEVGREGAPADPTTTTTGV